MSERGYMIVQIRNSERALEWESAVPNVVICKRPLGSDTLTLYWGDEIEEQGVFDITAGYVATALPNEKSTFLDPDLGVPAPSPDTLALDYGLAEKSTLLDPDLGVPASPPDTECP